ncbi:4-hydroxy-tetrahydrodipicolinate synthase [Rhodopseudomonas sp. AAP120]|uniref:4-hydroxy-tetrahydrodipicolinate synthase n=1 Tax=Rhodopseudomonas sp. AAP120 TaxID=1523430 RepID=UPI0006B9D2DA|nr:4-hydroxy-tetrahydrodipicolinate synthase [Rhodopseudomonas sp. AAP120]KPF97100.1 4-hydroxy-tetrahydrodipicolinate synthase [Rhodopseudomonas sp. AAP120]
MESDSEPPSGLWLPLITPFRDGALDAASLRRLIRHYARQPIDGLILAATTGEGLALDDGEIEQLAMLTAETLAEAGRALPVWLGMSGADTRKLVRTLARIANWPVDGYLIACPYYTRPSQDGLVLHFEALAEATARPIMLYNIPARTCVNLGNDALLRLAERPNIVGLKDCCAELRQTNDLLRLRPPGFSVLSGEDALFYGAQVRGCDGAVLASAHLETAAFAAVRQRILDGDRLGASLEWQRLADLPRLLFAEPSPAPLKYCLWQQGLIDSPQLRLPMTGVSPALAAALDARLSAVKTATYADRERRLPAG